MACLEEAYQAFEENFEAMQEAREIQVVSLPEGSDASADQTEVVRKLEARDRQLRATIERMRNGKNYYDFKMGWASLAT